MRNTRTGRSIAAAAVAISLALAATGCSDSGGAADSENSFTMWSMWSEGEPNQKIMQDAIDNFEKDTGITVNVVWKGRSPVAKLLPALNTDDVPADLVDSQNAELVNQLGATGNAADLSDVYGETIPGESETVGSVLNSGYEEDLTTDGSVYMVPYEVYTYALFYNQTRFPDIAAAPPTTWSEFADLLSASKVKGEAAPIALEGGIPAFSTFWTTALTLNSLGKGSFREAVADTSGQTWLEPGYLEVAKKLQSLVDDGYFIKDYLSAKYPAVQQEWASNKADFMYNGTWIPVETAPYAADDFDYGSFAFPVVGDAKPVMQVAFNGFAVVEKSKKQDAAKQFISYFLQKGYQEQLASDAKGIPARADITPDASVAGAVDVLNASDTVIAGDNVPWDDYMTKVFQPVNLQLFSGEVTAEQFVQSLAEKSASYWASNEQ